MTPPTVHNCRTFTSSFFHSRTCAPYLAVSLPPALTLDFAGADHRATTMAIATSRSGSGRGSNITLKECVTVFSFLKEYDTNDWLKMCYTVTHYFSWAVASDRTVCHSTQQIRRDNNNILSNLVSHKRGFTALDTD
ncbi:hypothetical protein LXL04_015757 [Taraxacum kok-saghyz]